MGTELIVIIVRLEVVVIFSGCCILILFVRLRSRVVCAERLTATRDEATQNAEIAFATAVAPVRYIAAPLKLALLKFLSLGLSLHSTSE